MNDTDRIASLRNTKKVEYLYNKPIASSDLNEVQSVVTSNMINTMNNITNTSVKLKWVGTGPNNNRAIMITQLSINKGETIGNGTDNEDIFQFTMPTSGISVYSPRISNDLHYKLAIWYRFREVNSKSELYKNGIRSSGITWGNNVPCVTPSDEIIPNNILGVESELREEVSTRIIIELTFTLYPANEQIQLNMPTTGQGSLDDPYWNQLIIRDLRYSAREISTDIYLNGVSGFIGFEDITGPKVFDYCISSSKNLSLLPTNAIPYDQYALALDTHTLRKKPANSKTWSFENPMPTMFTINSFIRINEFLDGSSIHDENCAGQAGYVIFDSISKYRILLDYGSDSDSTGIIYPEYVTIKNTDGTESVQLVNHPIIAPTFFSTDKSGAIYNDPDGDLLLCTTIDNDIYFRNIFTKV